MPDARPLPLRGLYAVTPEGVGLKVLLEKVEAVLRGGATLVQYRDKSSPAPRRAEAGRVLRELCHRFGARLIVNDDLALALAVDADGVHLGGDDGDLAAARRMLCQPTGLDFSEVIASRRIVLVELPSPVIDWLPSASTSPRIAASKFALPEVLL